MDLAKNLTYFRKKKNMRLATLAKKSGVKQPTLHGWTTGRSVQNLDDLKSVCDVLEVSLYQLLFSEADPHENPRQILKEIFKGDITVTIHRIEKERAR